jgi:hypothetical protein
VRRRLKRVAHFAAQRLEASQRCVERDEEIRLVRRDGDKTNDAVERPAACTQKTSARSTTKKKWRLFIKSSFFPFWFFFFFFFFLLQFEKNVRRRDE